MALITKAPRGTADVLPSESYKWQFVEKKLSQVANNFGFSEIRFPTFEHTELFERGVGNTTDVVQKEMYTFSDKGGRSVTLRPEGTASAARLVIENSLYAGVLPLKLWYIISCFRYEKPQAGRMREFHQFGAEVFGTSSPASDAEVISFADTILKSFGIKKIKLLINSIGCPSCRRIYTEALKSYFSNNMDTLCATCKERLNRNPMRLLDCKSENCKQVTANAPAILDYLCDECSEHFDSVKRYLDDMNIIYSVDPRIVRGLDYYTKTVFEFVTDEIGAQGTVLAGGRYDGLVEELGAAALCGLGFAMGIERLLLLLEKSGIEIIEPNGCLLFIANIGSNALKKAMKMANMLRAEGINAQCDILGRSLKAQMKYADKINAKYTVVLGDDELSLGECKIKNMETGKLQSIKLDELYTVLKNSDLKV